MFPGTVSKLHLFQKKKTSDPIGTNVEHYSSLSDLYHSLMIIICLYVVGHGGDNTTLLGGAIMEQRTFLLLYFKGPFFFFFLTQNVTTLYVFPLSFHASLSRFCCSCVCVDCRYGTLVYDFLVDDRHCLSEQEVRIP